MFAWFKKLKLIVSNHDAEKDQLKAQISVLESRVFMLEGFVKQHTEIAVDVNHNGANHIIMIGTYKNKDYIQTMRMPNRDFVAFVEQLRDMQKYGKVTFVDALPKIKASILREMRW